VLALCTHDTIEGKILQPTLAGKDMNPYIKYRILCIILLQVVTTGSGFAGSVDLDEAVKKYYAGHPLEAVEMIKPRALSGDVEAQYLLGNIIYGLSKDERFSSVGDPLRWYKMAAEQGSAEANNSIGIVYYNKWIQSRKTKDADNAIVYFQKAVDLGYEKAQSTMNQLLDQRQAGRQKKQTLIYTNSSFNHKPGPPEKQASGVKQSPEEIRTVDQAVQSLELTNDLIANAERIESLINQLIDDGILDDASESRGQRPDESAILRLLGDFESTDELFTQLIKLINNLKSVDNFDRNPRSE